MRNKKELFDLCELKIKFKLDLSTTFMYETFIFHTTYQASQCCVCTSNNAE